MVNSNNMNILDFWKNELNAITNTEELFDLSSLETNQTTSCQSKRDKFPSASVIDSNYPKPYHKDPPNCTDKNIDGSWAWDNQCAIRMSIALSISGVNFDSYTDPKCSHGHARGARSLASWIWKKFLCRPAIYRDSLILLNEINNKSGLIYFYKLGGSDTDHIDLYFKNRTQSDYSDLWTAEEYWFFKVNEN